MKLDLHTNYSADEIQRLFTEVFSESEGEEEGKLIGGLVDSLMATTRDEDLIGCVATDKNEVIGCIFFSRLSFNTPIDAFIMAPVAIRTDSQNKGIGQELINFGLGLLKEKDVTLAFTYGDPNYYSKVGFQCITESTIKAPVTLSQPEGWLCQTLDGNAIQAIDGQSKCVEAFNDPKYW
ncbi:GNAT family N-acetyltransferase [Saccharospirillum alexandrii]|uniref:GNAT family N-acetyltransferase n=1 Tax=Saccharospirillum alexandrii TaxID=2448477 RepID=UPI000FD97349|nr:N-acetyltransferase [Saccharospirillum alexandrii]